jgi:uncharacterized protein YjiS (DUF1127 family)
MNTTYVTPAIQLDGRSLLKAGLNLMQRALDTLLIWQERERQRRHLMALDNRLLSDMGLSRADAVAEYSKPFWRS